MTPLLRQRRYLRVSEFSDALGERLGCVIPQCTIRRWLAEGRLRGRKFGGRWRVLASELERLTKERA